MANTLRYIGLTSVLWHVMPGNISWFSKCKFPCSFHTQHNTHGLECEMKISCPSGLHHILGTHSFILVSEMKHRPGLYRAWPKQDEAHIQMTSSSRCTFPFSIHDWRGARSLKCVMNMEAYAECIFVGSQSGWNTKDASCLVLYAPTPTVVTSEDFRACRTGNRWTYPIIVTWMKGAGFTNEHAADSRMETFSETFGILVQFRQFVFS